MSIQLVTALGALSGCVLSLCVADPSALADATSSSWILPFTAGGFIYIATVSVIPELLENSSTGQGRKLWIVSAHVPAETAENNSKDAFYGELNALMSKIPSQQVANVGIDANAKIGLEQQTDLLRKWHYPA
ncbi:hypothetical protein RB195_022310 [Necator americanus]|uniref:SLC12A transporter C-terminal domain-containing protein n=1 Tax=Necator americanus TaxID=51031 RepID=A0ABR1EEU4_NECAM